MPKEYVCELCKKVFTQKGDLTKHSNKKQPCVSLEKLKEISKADDKNGDNKSNLTTIFKYCLDVLRDNEHLTGDKALRTLAHLLDLRLLEPQFGKTIDIDNYDYDFSHIEDEYIENHKKKLLTIARFSKLAEEKEDNIPNNMKYLWDDILSVHPKTKNIFQKGKGFDITNQSTYKKLINKLNTFNFENVEADTLGEAYEEVIQDIMIGKTLGQFFTPPKIKKMMVKLIDPQIKDDGTIEKIFDPAMGTGGFLITCVRHLVQKSKAKNIKLNWDFISKEGLGGREAEPDTYQLAVSNMMISTGHMFDVLEKGDSIRNPITNKYDIILANPPFGIDGLDYMEITNKLRNEYLPIKSNSAVPLFLQAIIYMLKVNGRCAVVLPDGKELFSKNNELVAVREFLMKTCDLKEVIYLPAGVFTHTTIKTCIFYFTKKKDGKDILETNIKISKITQKETGRNYKFSKTHQTNKINFYEFNPDTNVKHHLLEVDIDELSKNSYSLNYAEYLKDDTEDDDYQDEIYVKNLGDICDIDIGGTPSTSINEYYENGKNLWVSVRELNGGYITDTKEKITDLGVKKSSVKLFDIGTVLFSFKLSIGKTAIVGKPLYTNEAIAGLNSKNKDILDNKYLYYYLSINDFTKKGSGMLGNGSLNKKSLAKLKIPIPIIEKQKEIIQYLDFVYGKCIKTSEEKIEQLKLLNKYCINNQKSYDDTEVKNLGDITYNLPKRGKHSTKDHLDNGIYDLFSSSINEIYKLNTYDYDELCCIINSTNASGNAVVNIGKKFSVTNDTFVFKSKDDNMTKYIQLYLINNIELVKSTFKGANHKHPTWERLAKIKVYIPSIEKQKEAIDYCENNDKLIKNLEKEIESNKKIAESFMSNIIKKSNIDQNNELSDDESTNDNESIESKNEIKKGKNKSKTMIV